MKTLQHFRVGTKVKFYGRGTWYGKIVGFVEDENFAAVNAVKRTKTASKELELWKVPIECLRKVIK